MGRSLPSTTLRMSCAPTAWELSRAMEEQAVEGDGFGLEGLEFDEGELAFGDLAPAVDAGFGFLNFAPVEVAEEFTGFIGRSGFAQRGTREGLDGVTAEKFAPVLIEQIAGGKDVTPGDFAAIGDDHTDDMLTF